MKKMILITLVLMIFFAAFLKAENRSPLSLPTNEIILRAVLPVHIEPLSRIVNPPTMWEIFVGYKAYWDTSSSGNLEVSCYYQLYKNGNVIDCFDWARTNLYPNTQLKVEDSAGLHPGGNTYSANATVRYYFPGCHTPFREVGRTKTIAPLDLNN